MKKINNPAIAHALFQTENGVTLVIQTKQIAPRIKRLKELYHDTFVVMPRTTRYYYKRFYSLMDERKKTGKPFAKSPFELFKAAKPVLRKIAGRSEAEYNAAFMTVQFTWSSQKTLTDTIELVLG
ncbi:unnamed protein product [marine sediment metagenome]|uniref:Uncharacterized protein n=1 Tax=marine sediment metagenome TaxID=412755 RepID=X0TNW4_9ZZZZ